MDKHHCDCAEARMLREILAYWREHNWRWVVGGEEWGKFVAAIHRAMDVQGEGTAEAEAAGRKGGER